MTWTSNWGRETRYWTTRNISKSRGWASCRPWETVMMVIPWWTSLVTWGEAPLSQFYLKREGDAAVWYLWCLTLERMWSRWQWGPTGRGDWALSPHSWQLSTFPSSSSPLTEARTSSLSLRGSVLSGIRGTEILSSGGFFFQFHIDILWIKIKENYQRKGGISGKANKVWRVEEQVNSKYELIYFNFSVTLFLSRSQKVTFNGDTEEEAEGKEKN